MHPYSRSTLLVAALIGASCAGPEREPAPAPRSDEARAPEHAPPPMEAERLEPSTCGEIERLHTVGGVFLASQPEAQDFEQAASSGIKTVLDLRKPGELSEFDERATVEGLGMSYVNVPFSKPEEMTDDVLDRAREVLNDPERKPILVHCASANRVGAVWLAHRVLDGGLAYDEALAEAKTVGLKAPALELRAKEYIDARSDGK